MSLIPNDLATIEAELVVLIREQILETPADFSEDSDLYEAGLDSLAIMQLLIVLEEKYGVAISDAEISTQNFRSARRIAQLLHSRFAPG